MWPLYTKFQTLMKRIVAFILCCGTIPAFSQFAYITDKDGYANIRAAAVLADNIEDSLNTGHLVYCLESKGNWANIDYTKNGAWLTGFVYRNRLMMVDNFEKIPKQHEQPHFINFSKDSVRVIIRSQPFVRAKNKIFYSQENPGIVELVNGKLPFGIDGNLPGTAYLSFDIQIGNRNIILPATAYDDLFEPALANTKINYDRRKDTLYLHSLNGDGAGGYYVIWRFEKGQYKDRYIAYGF